MKTILLVDDEAYLRMLVYTTLDDPAYRILEATDGNQALAMARAEHLDLLVLDLMMPGLSGIAVAEALRQEPTTAPYSHYHADGQRPGNGSSAREGPRSAGLPGQTI